METCKVFCEPEQGIYNGLAFDRACFALSSAINGGAQCLLLSYITCQWMNLLNLMQDTVSHV